LAPRIAARSDGLLVCAHPADALVSEDGGPGFGRAVRARAEAPLTQLGGELGSRGLGSQIRRAGDDQVGVDPRRSAAAAARDVCAFASPGGQPILRHCRGPVFDRCQWSRRRGIVATERALDSSRGLAARIRVVSRSPFGCRASGQAAW
jgi:hypothetical protein